MTDIADLAFNKELYDSYMLYKDPKPLADAVRNGDPDAQSKIMRGIIADIIEGKTNLPTKGTTSKRVFERNHEIVRKIIFYNGARIPIKSSTYLDKNNCCGMIAEQYGLHEDTVYKEIWKKRRRGLATNAIMWAEYQTQGRMIYHYNNNAAPSSRAVFDEIESTLCRLPDDEWCHRFDLAKGEVFKEMDENREKDRIEFYRKMHLEDKVKRKKFYKNK